MIRAATHLDLPRLLELGQRMHAESERFSRLKFDPQRLRFTLMHAIDHHFCMVAEREGVVIGGLAAMLTAHWFSADLTACDIALFVDPEHRGGTSAARLLTAYKDWAKAKGSKLTLMGVMTGVDVDKTVRLCELLGWQRAGVVMEA
jgi:GNAT superfamily N-acetyltransferase